MSAATTSSAAVPAPVQRRVTAAGFLGFALLGAVLAAYGPAIPAVRRAFGVDVSTAGLLPGVHFVGAVAGILAVGGLGRRLPPRSLLAASTALLGVGAFAVSAAPAWPVALGGALLVGLGFGGLDVSFNHLFATGYGARGAAMLNLLNAAFGVGAVLGPLLVGAAAGFRAPFLWFGLAAAALMPLVLSAPGGRHATPQRGVAAPIPRRAVAAFVALFALYVGVETGVGSWAPTHLVSLGRTEAQAAGLAAVFWAALTAGRLLAAPVSLRVRPDRLVAACLAASLALVSLGHVPGLAPAAYALSGFALAPVFPTALAWLVRAVPSSATATAVVIAGANLGGVVFVPLVGVAVQALGPGVVPTALSSLALAAAALGAVLSRVRPAR